MKKPPKLYYNDGSLRLHIRNDIVGNLGLKNKDKLVMFPLEVNPFKDKSRVTWALRLPFRNESKYRWAKKTTLVENRTKKYRSYFIRIPKTIERKMLWKDGQGCLVDVIESRKWISVINITPFKIPEELKAELELFINRLVPGGGPGLYKDKELSKPASPEEIHLHILKAGVKGKKYESLYLKYLDIIKKYLKENVDKPSLFHEEIIRLRKASLEELSLIVDLLPILPEYNISVKMLLKELPEYLKDFKRWKVLRAKVLRGRATVQEQREYKTLLENLKRTRTWKMLHEAPKQAI